MDRLSREALQITSTVFQAKSCFKGRGVAGWAISPALYVSTFGLDKKNLTTIITIHLLQQNAARALDGRLGLLFVSRLKKQMGAACSCHAGRTGGSCLLSLR